MLLEQAELPVTGQQHRRHRRVQLQLVRRRGVGAPRGRLAALAPDLAAHPTGAVLDDYQDRRGARVQHGVRHDLRGQQDGVVPALACLRQDRADEARREALFTMAREAKQQGWWQSYADVLPSEYSTLIDLEADRQRVVERDYPPHLWVVLSEAAVRRVVSGPEVMRGQLRALAEGRDRANVTIQVLSFASGEHPTMSGAFGVLEFPDPDADVAFVENMAGNLFLERPEEIRMYAGAFTLLQAAALGPRESRAMLEAAANQL